MKPITGPTISFHDTTGTYYEIIVQGEKHEGQEDVAVRFIIVNHDGRLMYQEMLFIPKEEIAMNYIKKYNFREVKSLIKRFNRYIA